MESLSRFSSRTTIHGWNQVFGEWCGDPSHTTRTTRTLRRLFWACVLLGSVAFLLLYGSDKVLDYYEYRVVTGITMNTRYMPLPVITVFNRNELELSRLTAKDILHTGEYVLGYTDNFTDIVPEVKQHLNKTMLRYLLRKGEDVRKLSPVEKEADFDIREFFYRVGQQEKDLIVSCEWHDGVRVSSCEDVGNITRGLVYVFGNAYSVNRGGEMVYRAHGYHSGLFLRLNVQADKYLPFKRRARFLQRETFGIYVAVHSPAQSNVYNKYYRLLDLNKSDGYKISINKVVRIEHLPPPWSSCYSASDADTYVAEDCIQTCLSRLVHDRFGCILYDMSPLNYSRTCLAINNDYRLSTRTRANGKYMERCRRECPVSCTEWEYDFTIQERRKTVPMPRGHIHLQVGALDRLQYEVIKEIPLQDISDLLSEIGGMMGLFLGASIISMLDLAVFCMDAIKILLSRHTFIQWERKVEKL